MNADAPAPSGRRRFGGRLFRVGIGVGAAAGVAVGAALIAGAATSPGSPSTNAASSSSGDSGSTSSTTDPGSSSNSSSSSTTTPSSPSSPAQGKMPRIGGGFFGPGLGLGGPVIHGQYTVQGPNGYETLDSRSGTVSDVTDTSGSTWSLTVKSSDGTSATFTVDTGTSVNGGEMGISSVKDGDTVSVVAIDDNGTATAKEIVDQSQLQSNGSSWAPQPPNPPSSSNTTS